MCVGGCFCFCFLPPLLCVFVVVVIIFSLQRFSDSVVSLLWNCLSNTYQNSSTLTLTAFDLMGGLAILLNLHSTCRLVVLRQAFGMSFLLSHCLLAKIFVMSEKKEATEGILNGETLLKRKTLQRTETVTNFLISSSFNIV